MLGVVLVLFLIVFPDVVSSTAPLQPLFIEPLRLGLASTLCNSFVNQEVFNHAYAKSKREVGVYALSPLTNGHRRVQVRTSPPEDRSKQENLFAEDLKMPKTTKFPSFRQRQWDYSLYELDDQRLPEVFLIVPTDLEHVIVEGPFYYYIHRSHMGRVLIDPPPFSEELADKLQLVGGADLIIFSSKLRVHDHEKWKDRFPNVERVIHSLDVDRPSSLLIERKLQGEGPWALDSDITLILTPGKTPGHLCLLYHPKRGERALFSGDLVGYDMDMERLDGFAEGNSYSIREQALSMSRLLDEEFRWLLPGVGQRRWFYSSEQRRREIDLAVRVFAIDGHEEKAWYYRNYKPDIVRSASFSSEAFTLEQMHPDVAPTLFSVLDTGPVVSNTAKAYFLMRKEGNVLIDCPPFDPKLALEFGIRGGLELILITHPEGARDHEKWKEQFPRALRMMHMRDMTESTKHVEIRLRNNGPWKMNRDLSVYHTPGRSGGHLCVLYKKGRGREEGLLFSGDQFQVHQETKSLTMALDRCSFDMNEQRKSTKSLATLGFLWVMPTGGHSYRFTDRRERYEVLLTLAEQQGETRAEVEKEKVAESASAPKIFVRRLEGIQNSNAWQLAYFEGIQPYCYLIRGAGGNLLVNPPMFSETMVHEIQQLLRPEMGLDFLVWTGRDKVLRGR